MSEFILILVFSLVGLLLGCLMSLIPSLHIYNAAGIVLISWISFGEFIPYQAIAPFFISMVVAFAFINTLPMNLLGAPDESATATILPNSKYLMLGRGYEAVVLSGIGSLLGIFILILGYPITFKILPKLHKILGPNMHWIIMSFIVYMIMSEWPKGEGIGDTVWKRFKHAWSNLFAGILTFILAGFLGLLVTGKTLVSPEAGFQNIMPVFIGLFAIPGSIQQLLSREKIPEQYVPETVDMTGEDLGYSCLQGSIAGSIAAYIPAVTAGIGGIVAGHGVARRGDKLFIISGGVSKVLYYVGAFTLLYLVTPYTPGGIGRGGLAIILKPVLQPLSRELPMILGVILLTGCLSFLLLLFFAKHLIKLIKIIDYHIFYYITLPLLTVLVLWITGIEGLFLMIVASCIGMIPVFFQSRRSNCMAVLLVPIALNMAGYSDMILRLLGIE